MELVYSEAFFGLAKLEYQEVYLVEDNRGKLTFLRKPYKVSNVDFAAIWHVCTPMGV